MQEREGGSGETKLHKDNEDTYITAAAMIKGSRDGGNILEYPREELIRPSRG